MADYTARSSVILNGQQADDQLEKLTNRAKGLRDEMKKLRQANDLAGFKEKERELKEVNKEMRQMRKEVFSVEAVLKNLSGASFKDISAAARKANAEFKAMKQTDPGYSKKALEVKVLNGKMRELSSLTRAQQGLFGRMADGFNKYFGMATAWLASMTGIILGVKKMKNTLDEFEETMTNIYTLLDEADYNKFKNLLDEGSVELLRQYGFEIKDINKALFDTISAGVPAGESIKFMKEASVLAKGGVTSLSVSVDGMTSIINAYGLAMDEANQVSAAFFTAQKYGKTTVEELASTVGSAVPIAAQAGVTYRELLSSVAALTTQGISTDMAMTAVKNALQSLLKPGKEAEEILRKFGVPVGATEVRARGLGYTLERLNKVMEENPDAVSKAIPNIRGLTAVAALSGKGLEKYHEILSKVNQDFGDGSSLMNAYTKQMDTDVAKQKARLGELQATILELGDDLRPMFVELIRLGNWSFRTLLQLVRLIADNKGIIFSLIAGITAYTVAVKAHIIWQKLYNTVVQIGTTATKAFNTAVKTNYVGLFISLLTAAATAFVFYKNKAREAAPAQKEFNDMVEQGNNLLLKTKTLEERASIIKNLSKEQLENFKSDLQNQLKAEEEYHTLLLQKLRKKLGEDEELKKLAEARSQQGLSQLQQISLDAQINARRKALAEDLESENKSNQQRLAQLNGYLIKVNDELKTRPTDGVTGTAGSDAALNALEIANKQRILELQQQYANEENMQKFLHARLLANEIAYLQAKEQLETDEGKKLDLQTQIVQKQAEYNKSVNDAIEPLRLKKKAVEEVNASLLEEGRLMQRNAEVAAKAASEQDELNKKLTAQAQNYQDTIQVISDNLFQMMSGSEDAFKVFAKNILIFALEQLKLQAQLAAAGVTIQSLAQPDSVATFGASGLARAAIIVGLIEAAFAVVEGAVNGAFSNKTKKYATGKYPGATFVGRPETGIYDDKPHLAVFNEVPGQPEMVIDGVLTRKLQLDYPGIMKAIWAVKDGRSPQQYASGKFNTTGLAAVSSPGSGEVSAGRRGTAGISAIDNTTANRLAVAIERFMEFQPTLAIDLFERKKQQYNDIQNKSSM